MPRRKGSPPSSRCCSRRADALREPPRGAAMAKALRLAPDDELISAAIADGRFTRLPDGVAIGALHAGDFNRQRR